MKTRKSSVVPALLNEKKSTAQLETAYALALSSAPVKPANEYVELKKLIKKNGLLDKQPIYYTYKTHHDTEQAPLILEALMHLPQRRDSHGLLTPKQH